MGAVAGKGSAQGVPGNREAAAYASMDPRRVMTLSLAPAKDLPHLGAVGLTLAAFDDLRADGAYLVRRQWLGGPGS